MNLQSIIGIIDERSYVCIYLRQEGADVRLFSNEYRSNDNAMLARIIGEYGQRTIVNISAAESMIEITIE